MVQRISEFIISKLGVENGFLLLFVKLIELSFCSKAKEQVFLQHLYQLDIFVIPI
jgi:hypothetical protein